jgi:MFS family permease
MGGEFGSAVIYISELAGVKHRGRFVALLQNTVNVGMIMATLLVMLLQNTISEGELHAAAPTAHWVLCVE